MSMLGHQEELHRPLSSANSAWTSFDPLDIDDPGVTPFVDEGDGSYNHDADSGSNEQSWVVDNITAFEGGKLRGFVVYLGWMIGYSGASSVRILLDGTHYNCTKITVTDSTTTVWEAWVAYPDVDTSSGFTSPEVKVTSGASEVRLDVMLCHSICLRNGHLLRPTSEHSDRDWGFATAIDEPIFYGGWKTGLLYAHDNTYVADNGKTSAPGTWAAHYTDDIPATPNGTLAFIQAWAQNETPTRIYVNDTAYTDDHIENFSFNSAGAGPHTWYRNGDDLSSGISNMGLGVFEPNLGTGEEGEHFRAGYLIAVYDDDSYGHARLVPIANGTGGRSYDQMNHGMDAKTGLGGSWPGWSYGLGNETSYYPIGDAITGLLPSDLDEVTGLSIFICHRVSALDSNNTYLSTVRIVESDESTALTNTVDATGLLQSTADFTERLDFVITNGTGADWTGASLELDFDIEGAGTQSHRMLEIELVMEYKKTSGVDTSRRAILLGGL